MSKLLKNKKSFVLPIILCMMVMFAIPIFAYQNSGGSVNFTLSDGQKKYTNRDQNSSWNAPGNGHSKIILDLTKKDGSSNDCKLKKVQVVQQNNIWDTVFIERFDVTGTLRAEGHSQNTNNRNFFYAEWSKGSYSGNAKLTW